MSGRCSWVLLQSYPMTLDRLAVLRPREFRRKFVNGDSESCVSVVKESELCDVGPAIDQEEQTVLVETRFADLHLQAFRKVAYSGA